MHGSASARRCTHPHRHWVQDRSVVDIGARGVLVMARVPVTEPVQLCWQEDQLSSHICSHIPIKIVCFIAPWERSDKDPSFNPLTCHFTYHISPVYLLHFHLHCVVIHQVGIGINLSLAMVTSQNIMGTKMIIEIARNFILVDEQNFPSRTLTSFFGRHLHQNVLFSLMVFCMYGLSNTNPAPVA